MGNIFFFFRVRSRLWQCYRWWLKSRQYFCLFNFVIIVQIYYKFFFFAVYCIYLKIGHNNSQLIINRLNSMFDRLSHSMSLHATQTTELSCIVAVAF